MTGSAALPVAVTIGDPAGIGPEIIAACWKDRAARGLPRFCVVGGADILASAADVPVQVVSDMAQASACFGGALPVLPLAKHCAYTPGNPSTDGAQLALASLEAATALVRDGAAFALVTAPISKARLAEVGFDFPGQTEFVANRCGLDPAHAVMMLAGDHLKIVPLTVHIALADVPGALTGALIVAKARIVAAALARDFGIRNPRLALAALNPHAGEDGRFGDEDKRMIAPAVAVLAAEGIHATGPHPADTLFHAAARTRYDAVLAMYHDQALIPIKTLDFDNAVNVTLGLPIVRTSPDHGTAFDIAGKGIARADSMAAALRLAASAAARRRA